MAPLTRRRLILGGAPVIAGAALLKTGPSNAAEHQHQHASAAAAPAAQPAHAGHADAHATFRGKVDSAANGFDPQELLRDFDTGKTRRLPGGRVERTFELVALEQEIEVAPGVKFPAWTYNGRMPGPTLRAREGDLVRIRFTNGSNHPHTVHFHGIHVAPQDGVGGLGSGNIAPGQTTVYEFEAAPFGMHLYHCHVRPLAEHIAKGLFGAFIIDPKEGRRDADEMVMVMHGIDTNFDRENEVYAVNGIGFAYMDPPIQVKRDELVRLYLANMTEYDPINSYHLHGNFFEYFPTGTSLEPSEYTDTVMQCQGQRGILEWRFPSTGMYMFHAHQSEFTELGWQGFFEVTE
ncbi:MAG TPA: multicopper oxidase domain-containing protein [Solirubrobacteraceae bacterium]|nr:multicopper oxidase domain-containing protein [Solirubrobacteraceae bacterium]